MSRAKHTLVPAWILRAQPYRDTSLLVEALTRDQGRVGLVARGARSARGGRRELLQSFRPVLLSWSESGDLGALTSVEANGFAVALSGEQVFSGWYLNELVLRLVHRHDPHPEVFAAYSRALGLLTEGGEAELRYFEMALLAELGFALDLPETIDPEAHYVLYAGATLRRAEPGDGQACSGATLIALREQRLDSITALREARQLLRTALAPQLGERPLSTATTLRRLRRGS